MIRQSLPFDILTVNTLQIYVTLYEWANRNGTRFQMIQNLAFSNIEI